MSNTALIEEKRNTEHGTPNTVSLYLRTLSLHHFRNYASARLELSSGPVVLTGPNGAGKTNILEAVSLLTPGRGLRKAKLSDIDNMHEKGQPWVISANVSGMLGHAKIGTGRDPEVAVEKTDKRIVHIDEKTARSHAELGRHLAMIWLTPQMEQLFNQGTSDARKFLDRLVYSFDPDHAARSNEYEYAMRERNRLLQVGQSDNHWLDALEQTMAETGAAIASARLATAANINHAINLSTLSFPKAHIEVTGFVEEKLQAGMPAIEAEDAFKSLLRSNRMQDSTAGRALAGTHRSEMHVMHVEKGLPAASCSTGEQKALLLSIVLAQARSGALWRKVVPILLLDEVIAHLDATRKLELFEEICQIGAQTWMSGTDEKFFADLKGKAQYFRVENGMINHES